MPLRTPMRRSHPTLKRCAVTGTLPSKSYRLRLYPALTVSRRDTWCSKSRPADRVFAATPPARSSFERAPEIAPEVTALDFHLTDGFTASLRARARPPASPVARLRS